jgi:small subunit ribosomal protein S16
MLVIRLSRTGRKGYPTYRIVAADSRRAATGKFVMVLGHYNPHTKALVMKTDEINKYVANGAQPSNAVIKLLKQEKVKLPKWVELKTRNRSPKGQKPVEPAAATPEPAADASEATAEAEASDTAATVVETASKNADAAAEVAPDDKVAETAADVETQTAAATGEADSEA